MRSTYYHVCAGLDGIVVEVREHARCCSPLESFGKSIVVSRTKFSTL